MKKVLTLASNNFEDIEYFGTIDILKREGIEVDSAYSSDNEYVTSQNGHKIIVERTFKDVLNDLDQYDALFIPGGKGTEKLYQQEHIIEIIKYFLENKIVGAICSSPAYLAKTGLIKGKTIISHTSDSNVQLVKDGEAKHINPECVFGDSTCEAVVDGNLVTGLGVRSTIAFADLLAKTILN